MDPVPCASYFCLITLDKVHSTTLGPNPTVGRRVDTPPLDRAVWCDAYVFFGSLLDPRSPVLTTPHP